MTSAVQNTATRADVKSDALPTAQDVEAAQARIKGRIMHTPMVRAEKLSAVTGVDIWLKLENLQYTGAFKERGALNKLLLLGDDDRRRGVIAASAGNHAQGVAYHATKLGIPATICMPVNTPIIKVQRTRGFGAEVVLESDRDFRWLPRHEAQRQHVTGFWANLGHESIADHHVAKYRSRVEALAEEQP